ncbi:hypothetical protein IHE44_0007871, partial [Lamprotornis superbus]
VGGRPIVNGNSLHCDFSSCAAGQCRSHSRAVGHKGSDLLPVKMCQQQGAPMRRELSQGPFGLFPDDETEICVSYKYISQLEGWGLWLGWENLEQVQGGEKGKRHLTFPALERTVLTSHN